MAATRKKVVAVLTWTPPIPLKILRLCAISSTILGFGLISALQFHWIGQAWHGFINGVGWISSGLMGLWVSEFIKRRRSKSA